MKILFLVFLFSITQLYCEEVKLYSIEGRVKIQNEGSIYIFLVDEDTFSEHNKCIQLITRKITKKEISNNELLFVFENIKPGRYGIRSFIDSNNNTILDKGLFGPKEPWGMSFSDHKSKVKPKFDQISFVLNSDKKIKFVVD